jgi:uncharacterized membrane protein
MIFIYYIVINAVIAGMLLLLGWLWPSLMSPTLPFGVRIPPTRSAEPAIAQTRRFYRRGLFLGGLLALLLLLLPPLITPGAAVLWTAPLAVITLLILTGLFYALAHRRLHRIKEREQWYAGLRQAIVVEVPSLSYHWRPSPFWSALNVLLLVAMFVIAALRYPALPARIPTHFDLNGRVNAQGSSLTVFLFPSLALLLTLGLAALAWYVPRLRKQLDPADPEASRLERQRQWHLWSDFLLAIAAVINALFLLLSLLIAQILPASGITLLIVLTGQPVLLLVLFSLLFFYLSRLRQARTYKARTEYVARDDDRYWIAGLFYLNHDDPALIVERRTGLGWTLNLGHPLGMGIAVALVALIVTALLLILLSVAR